MPLKSLLPIVEVKKYDTVFDIFNYYENIDEILLHPKIRRLKVVVVSIVELFNEDQNMILKNCLKFLYAKVNEQFF